MLRIQIKTNIDKDRAYSALLLSSTRICLILDFLLKIVGDTIFYNFLNFQLLKYQNLCFPTLSNRNQHQTDSNSVLHLQIPKNILSISSSREKNFSCHWVYQRYFTCLYLPWSNGHLSVSNFGELAELLFFAFLRFGHNFFTNEDLDT